jgi:hypothetical protein
MEKQFTSEVDNRDHTIASLRQKLSDKEEEINVNSINDIFNYSSFFVSEIT